MTAMQTIETPHPKTGPQASLKTIVVGTDFSENAAKALKWVNDIAKAHGAKVVLAHAIETELPALADQGLLTHHIERKLECLRDLHQLAGQPAFAPGKPWEVINKIARERKSDLIVVGAHGESTYSERFLGTVADRLIKTTSIPVLVYRQGSIAGSRAIRTVLAATDFSEEAAVAISAAVNLLHGSNEPARLVLFHAAPLMISYSDINIAASNPQFWDDAERQAAHQLDSLAASLSSDRLQVQVKTSRGYPVDGILAEAQNIGADLIVIGTLGRTGLTRFLIGSVAEQVLHRSTCSVLTARRPDPSEPIRMSIE